MVKDIVIVGGGTAGWLTALVAQKNFPQHHISLIESSEIGILGAGEGSTPHLPDVLEYLDIRIEELVQNTSSTIKNGIIFDGWSEDRRPYLHGFDVYDTKFQKESLNFVNDIFGWSNAPVLSYLAEYFSIEDDQVDILTYASLQNKVFFNQSFKREGIYAIHFDAQSLAQFLSKKAIERGVVRVEGKVVDVVLDINDNISTVNLDGGRQIPGDFFFDCTGFARLLIGKTYGSEWISFKESLPAKRAMPFFLEPDKNIPPYTKAKAMDYGWVWKIPLQHRYGCGYVYDPDQVSDDDVKLEIDRLVGHEVSVPRIFNFDPGYFRRVWIKNCLALGLANGFVEPLEATSIMQMLISMQKFFEQKHMVFTNNEEFKMGFNNSIEKDQVEIASFIYLHYITNKTNNSFWKNFTHSYKTPDVLKQTLQRLYYGILNSEDLSDGFDTAGYLTVARGNGILKKENIDLIYETSLKDKQLMPYLQNLLLEVPLLSNKFVDHTNLLKHLGAKIEK